MPSVGTELLCLFCFVFFIFSQRESRSDLGRFYCWSKLAMNENENTQGGIVPSMADYAVYEHSIQTVNDARVLLDN